MTITTYSASRSWNTGWIEVTSFNASGNPVTPTVKLPNSWSSFLDADVENRSEGNYRIRISVVPSEVRSFRSNSGNQYIYVGNSYDSESLRIELVIKPADITVSSAMPGTIVGWDSGKYMVIEVESDEADPVYGAGTLLYSFMLAAAQNIGTSMAFQAIGYGGSLGGRNHRKILGERVKIIHAWKNCTINSHSSGVPSDYGDEVSDLIVDRSGRKISSKPSFVMPDNEADNTFVLLEAGLTYRPI